MAIRDTLMAHTGGETIPSPHHSTGCAACPSFLFSPPGQGCSTLAARWKRLVQQYTSGIMRGDTVGLSDGTLISRSGSWQKRPHPQHLHALKQASIMASATPFCCCTRQKHLGAER